MELTADCHHFSFFGLRAGIAGLTMPDLSLLWRFLSRGCIDGVKSRFHVAAICPSCQGDQRSNLPGTRTQVNWVQHYRSDKGSVRRLQLCLVPIEDISSSFDARRFLGRRITVSLVVGFRVIWESGEEDVA